MQLFPNNMPFAPVRVRAAHWFQMINVACCLLLLLVAIMNLHRSLEACCLRGTALVAESRNGATFDATSTRQDGQVPAQTVPVHCAVCHAAGQIALFAAGLGVLLILVTLLMLPLLRMSGRMLFAPPPPPPRIA